MAIKYTIEWTRPDGTKRTKTVNKSELLNELDSILMWANEVTGIKKES